jgi:hypothetical protein
MMPLAEFPKAEPLRCAKKMQKLEAPDGKATGLGKTAIAFQIAWKLFHARWNLKRDGIRRPRIS